MLMLCSSDADVYGQAASNLVSGNNLEQTIQNILDMGGGTWDRDTVVRALRAAYNNPERAIDYLYSVSSIFVLRIKSNISPSGLVFVPPIRFGLSSLNTIHSWSLSGFQGGFYTWP
jgi:hypothetical protein